MQMNLLEQILLMFGDIIMQNFIPGLDPLANDFFNLLPWLVGLVVAASVALFALAYFIRRPRIKSPTMSSKPEFRTVMFAATGFVILVLPINYFHEFGHGFVCTLSGGEARMSPPTAMGIGQVCLNSYSNVELNRAMGGSFGVMGALSSIIFYKIYKQNALYLGILAACLALASGELLKAFFEPLYFGFYSTPEAATIFSIIQVCSLAVFVLLLGGKAKEATQNVGPRIQ